MWAVRQGHLARVRVLAVTPEELLLLRLLAALGERGAAGGSAVAQLGAILRRRRELRAERPAELAGHSVFALLLFPCPRRLPHPHGPLAPGALRTA